MPSLCAQYAMLGGPTSRASCANTTLMESCVAVHRSMYLLGPAPSAFETFQLLHCGRNCGDFSSYTRPGGTPCSRAVTSVNSLNADPACLPAVPFRPVTRSWCVAEKFRPDTSTRMAPVFASTVEMAASGSEDFGRCCRTTRTASCSKFGSSVV